MAKRRSRSSLLVTARFAWNRHLLVPAPRVALRAIGSSEAATSLSAGRVLLFVREEQAPVCFVAIASRQQQSRR